MHVIELGHTAYELRGGRFLIDRFIGPWLRCGQGNIVDIDMRARVVVSASPISRSIANNGRQQPRGIVRSSAQSHRIWPSQQRAERFLHDIECVDGIHAFAARDPCQPAGLAPSQLRNPFIVTTR